MDNKADLIKKEIFAKVAEYYSLVHKPKEFLPGKSRVPYAARVFDEKEMQALVDSALEFWLTYGGYSERFEAELGRYIGTRHVFFVNSGSSANLLAVAALASPKLGDRRLRPGDEAITVAACFPTTVAPLIQHGVIPVFVDVSLPTYNIDSSRLKAALSSRTKAVVLAHTLGNPFDIGAVKEFCVKHGLWLIEDNCDALGSRYDGRFTGTFGDIATGSFYPPHHITTGEGGAVYTGSSELAEIVASIRDWGRDCFCPSGKDNTCKRRFSQKFGELPAGYDHKYVYSHFGYNLKATDMQAAIGCVQLEKLPAFTEARKKNFSFLYDRLRHLEDKLVLPRATENSDPSWFGFLLTVRGGCAVTRDMAVRFLEDNGVQTRMLLPATY